MLDFRRNSSRVFRLESTLDRIIAAIETDFALVKRPVFIVLCRPTYAQSSRDNGEQRRWQQQQKEIATVQHVQR